MDNEKYRKAYIEAVQPHIPDEQVLAVGGFSRAGTWGSFGLGKGLGAAGLGSAVSNVAGMIGSKRSKEKAGGLPESVLIAVTPDKVHVFDYKPTRSSVKIKSELAVWDRSAIKVTRSEGATTHQLAISFTETGDEIGLETPKMGNFNEEAMQLLVQSPSG